MVCRCKPLGVRLLRRPCSSYYYFIIITSYCSMTSYYSISISMISYSFPPPGITSRRTRAPNSTSGTWTPFIFSFSLSLYIYIYTCIYIYIYRERERERER